MQGFLLEDEKIKKYIEDAREGAEERKELLASVDRRIEKVHRKMDSLLDLYGQGALGATEFRRKFKPLEKEKEEMVESIPKLKEEIRQLESESVTGEGMVTDGKKLVEEWPKMNWDRKRETVENVVHRIAVDGNDIDFVLQYLPGQLSKNPLQTEGCAEARGGDPGSP